MSCILRISGLDLNVDHLLTRQRLKPDTVWRKGEPHNSGAKVHTDSGANFIASEADLDEFGRQVEEATIFLEQHAEEITAMVGFPGTEHAVLDFGIEMSSELAVKIDCLPARFIQSAARAGVAVELSHYLCSEDEEQES